MALAAVLLISPAPCVFSLTPSYLLIYKTTMRASKIIILFFRDFGKSSL